jgi:tetratricopeptide (TPR) repeat protein
MALVSVVLAVSCLLPIAAGAQSSGAARDLKDGIEQFRNGLYDKAILLFHNVILDPSATAEKPQAYLLIAKSSIAIGKLADAGSNLEFYIANYPDASDYPEALYQKGRLLFLQDDLESALQVLALFIQGYPGSAFVSSAWFWAGESLSGLGRLDDALTVYQKIVTDFPSSVKLEAAQYRISLIKLQKKEVELAKLLKWSHEEFLRSIEEYQNREKAYEQAIEAYQKRLAGSGAATVPAPATTTASAEPDTAALDALRRQLGEKTDEANRLAAQIAALRAAAVASSGSSDQSAHLVRLLAAKQDALALKEKYLSWIQANGGASK